MIPTRLSLYAYHAHHASPTPHSRKPYQCRRSQNSRRPPRPIRKTREVELSQLSHRFRRRANFTPLFQRLSGSFPNHPSLAISPFSRQQQIHRTGIDPSPANLRIRNYAAIANSRPQVRRAQVFLTPHSSSLSPRSYAPSGGSGLAVGPAALPCAGGFPPQRPPPKLRHATVAPASRPYPLTTNPNPQQVPLPSMPFVDQKKGVLRVLRGSKGIKVFSAAPRVLRGQKRC